MTFQNHGIVKTAPGIAAYSPIPTPTIPDGYLLVRTIAAALNRADWQTLDEEFAPRSTQALLGTDAAGVVIEVEEGVTKKFKVGDRVAGLAHGGHNLHPDYGAFAEYILLKGDLAIPIPDQMTLEDASTLPAGLVTVASALYKHLSFPFLGLPVRKEKVNNGPPILIYGGSSDTGTLAIHFAKLQAIPNGFILTTNISGRTVITTASPRNFTFLKSLGADHVIDHHDPACGQKINILAQNNSPKSSTQIATPSSAAICAPALSSILADSIYVNLMGIPFPRAEVKNVFFLGYTAVGEPFDYEGETWDAVPEDWELGERFIGVVEEVLEEKLIQNHPTSMRSGGLAVVLNGMEELKSGKVSGVKLVYRVGDV